MIVLDFTKVDKQGRVSVSDFLTPGDRVLFFVARPEEAIRLKKLSENENPHGKIASVDSKGRVIIPASYRWFFCINEGTRFEVGYDEEEAVVTLLFSPSDAASAE